ncbi:hypothetical protein E2562_036109 [Oryza meyeriana var. granulata]|uniref:Uncharacterized protein n=1 Tax=Oryza meyeriana var. granulata TaxID=110450 RepID=A0A6G1DTI5_9ORYZ|nr:hypothetical protein E2562_036109 [Oryza meyeriana var. granulata]
MVGRGLQPRSLGACWLAVRSLPWSAMGRPCMASSRPGLDGGHRWRRWRRPRQPNPRRHQTSSTDGFKGTLGSEDGGDLGVRKEGIQWRITGSIFSGHHLAGLVAVAAGFTSGAARARTGEEGRQEVARLRDEE